MINKEEGVSFEGFKAPAQEQPQVFMKDGKPYDMNDDQFPIIHGHKFTFKYWAMPVTDMARLKYLDEHWHYFNQTRFHNALKPCKFALLKDMNAWRMKKRGDWSAGLRRLRVSPNLFNSPHEGWVNRVLLHEMAHQYVTDFHGVVEREEKGHGPLWRAAMRMADLTPLRYDLESNETYTDPFEKRVKEAKDEKKNAFWIKYPDKLWNHSSVSMGLAVVFQDKKLIEHIGLVADVKQIGKYKFARVVTDARLGTWLNWKVPLALCAIPPDAMKPNPLDPNWANALKGADKL